MLDNAARQLGLLEQQLKLEVRKLAFQEEQLQNQKRMQQQQYHGRGYGYRIAYGEPRSHVSPFFPVRQDHQYENSYSGQRSDHQPYDRYGPLGIDTFLGRITTRSSDNIIYEACH